MNGYEMVFFIVLVVTIGSVLRSTFGFRRGRRDRDVVVKGDAESIQLRDEVRQLKERLQVIERITVEKESSLEREIERLRDRP
jgi:uncharacterized protein YlxW (UPF0749 family)